MDYKLFTRHIKSSGHKLCRCGGYHYSHRPGSRCCEQNPMSVYWLAVRRGDSEEDLLNILVELHWGKDNGKKGDQCPF